VKTTLGPVVLLAASSAVSAQTSVTLYGRMDGGIEYINHIANGNGGSSTRWSAEGGDWGTSMLGFKGTEDLGGGTAALFTLETALQIMNGTTGDGRLFSRRAYVGLKNETWGQLQAGRNLFIDSDGVWEFDPFEGEGDVSHDPASHATLYAFGTTYNLSARTFLYGTLAYVNNSHNGTFSVFATPRDSSTPTSPLPGESQTGAYVGMMHVF